MGQFSDVSKVICTTISLIFSFLPKLKKHILLLQPLWGACIINLHACHWHMSMFVAQIVNIPLVLSLSPVNASAVTEPRGLWPAQSLCSWLSDGQNAQKRSAALLMWWRLSVVRSCCVLGLSLWGNLTGQRTNSSSTKGEWIIVFCGLMKYLQHECISNKALDLCHPSLL